MTTKNFSPRPDGTHETEHRVPRGRRLAMIAGATVGAAALAVAAAGLGAGLAHASSGVNCQVGPSACGFPDASNTGVPAGTTLTNVPAQATSGAGWSYNTSSQTLNVSTNGTTLSGLNITGNLNITASNVTIKNDQVTASGNYAVSLRHTANVTVENSTISGLNATTGRVSYAIDDIYGDSTGMVFQNNNIADWRIGINATTGQITGNYIHDPGFIAGDHTDGIYDQEGTGQLTISGNTVLNNIGQACAIMIESEAGVPVANKTITGNLLAGGDYVIYAGGAQNDSSNIVIQNNRFGQAYYATSGLYGPDAQFQPGGSGNSWSGNVWDSNGANLTP
jgi:hypothetical protein